MFVNFDQFAHKTLISIIPFFNNRQIIWENYAKKLPIINLEYWRCWKLIIYVATKINEEFICFSRECFNE